jgi:cation transport regulator ChaB
MPYSYPDNLPTYIKNLPAKCQKAFVSAFNSVYNKTNDDNAARRAGWGSVKNVCIKSGGKWIVKQ